MPTTLAGLLVFVVMLLPGFVFITIYTWDRPRRRWSAVEETAAIVLASFLIEAVTAGLYVVLARQVPKIAAPTLDLLIRKPGEHLGWVAGLLVVSAGLAALAAWPMRRRRVHPAVMSSWWTLFDKWQQGRDYTTTQVQCELDDGSCVTGVLGDWNTIEDDSPDRDLILGAPITYRPPGDREYHAHPVSVVCIPGRRIVAMFVNYSDATSSPAAEPGAAEEEEEAAEGTSEARSPDADRENARPPRSPSECG